MKKFGRLKRDTAYFLKGTEFEITNEDDGFWSCHAFYSGRIDGMYMSYEQKDVQIISEKEFSNRVLRVPPDPNAKKEEWWEYTNYP